VIDVGNTTCADRHVLIRGGAAFHHSHGVYRAGREPLTLIPHHW
jgi:hypothetical protein